ncbi:protein SMG7 [Nilaparvata lugens]|uniref:protein SMG7 n=1 Tax=Nilaparvata lugens TaxID=108931 RepID=UPI00193D7D3E|nr:protein SMG7 [Nilaparvata lugens]
MGLRAAVQALKKAERLKEKVANSKDPLNDKEAWICQQQLQRIYQQVLIIDLEYALDKKVEQDLWNHGFKKHIGTLQALAKDKKSRKNSLFGNFRKSRAIQFVNKPHKNSCYYICQHCLVHLGDIARYRNQCRQAEAFYRSVLYCSIMSHFCKFCINGIPSQLELIALSNSSLPPPIPALRPVAVEIQSPQHVHHLSLLVHPGLNVEGRTKLTSSEYVMLFLKLHAMLHLSSELDSCAGYVQLLTETLTAHIATQSFSSCKLVQMLTINIFAYHHSIRDADNDLQLTANEKRIRSLVTHLIAGSLNAFLLPVYTLKHESSMLDYFALPAIKLTMEWIRLEPEALAEMGFTKRLQIWPGLCRLLNGLQTSIQHFSKNSYSDVPLPEDRDLQGFKLLEKSFNGLNFGSKETDAKILMKLRSSRLVELGKWIAQLDQPKLITAKVSEDSTIFEAMGGSGRGCQASPSTELLRVLEELSLTKGDDSPRSSCDTPSSSTPELNNPAAQLLAAFQTVQEKRAGILKPQPSSEESGTRGRTRQNVALQAILKRTQEQEMKQVKFKTPSPSPPPQPPPTAPKPPPPQLQPPFTFPPTPPMSNAFHFPPPPPATALDTRFPPPPTVFAAPPPTNPWQGQDEKRQPPPPLWWTSATADRQVPPHSPREPANRSPFKTHISLTLTYYKILKGDPSHMGNTFSPTYSLFSGAWASHQQPTASASTATATTLVNIGQQSLWSGPGPSPLERLLEQQKQLREGPAPKGGT